MIAQENVPGDQQRMVGRWGTDRMISKQTFSFEWLYKPFDKYEGALIHISSIMLVWNEDDARMKMGLNYHR
ncbi:hypothetical protein A0J61_10900 [Choanephora cucurbitarum]|uniref:Uncharacterized protein n=1 Tax=Choanephora cucurbitarum TaxID=101091 RepID=A0A1C7MW38_9FUNG|nr:hypothetical protein A0J61_10900 [Choanephora cucurbitarum]